MTGPEHYREAERLLRIAKESSGQQRADCLAAAQVHATLAVAAMDLIAEDTSEAPQKGKRHRLTITHLQAVADVYTAALAEGEPPTRAVADHFSTTHSTAAKWVGHARTSSLLQPWTAADNARTAGHR